MNLRHIMLNKRRQAQRNTYCMITSIKSLRIIKIVTMLNCGGC